MDIFRELVKALVPTLKSTGFSKKGNSFYLVSGRNYGLLNFQKSKESTNDLIKITINCGIYSDFLGRSQYNYSRSAKPEIEQCHWLARIGNFMSGSPDYWWSASTSDDLSSITTNIVKAVENILIPEINKRLSDEGLVSSWMNDSYAGTTEIGRFKYLTTLLKEKGDFGTLDQVVEIFMQQSKGKPNASRAREHLKELIS